MEMVELIVFMMAKLLVMKLMVYIEVNGDMVSGHVIELMKIICYDNYMVNDGLVVGKYVIVDIG